MNRHHFALFVRHCRLILLLRKNYNDGDLNIFLPAEWRWKIPQVCDNEWHHYSITVDQPKVELFIDGVKFIPDQEDRHSNPEVIDDWPLHAAQGINTTLTIGACYQSSENRLKHGFRGDISSIKINSNKVLSEDDIKCGMNCAERLLSPNEKLIELNQQVQINTQMNEITIEGSDKQNIEQLLQKIQYVNDKVNPTIGRRNVQVVTTVSCPMKKAIRLPTIDTFIMISDGGQANVSTQTTSDYIDVGQEEFKPQITISGNQNNLVSYPDIKNGVKFLESVNIVIYSNDQVLENLQKLDSCSVNVFPNLNSDHEEITLSRAESEVSPTVDIKTTINKDGVEMIGYDTIANYLQRLRSLNYINRKPAYYLNRVFKLSCSQLGDRFHSAEFTLTLTVLHPKQTLVTDAPPTTEKPAVPAHEHDNSNLFNRVLLHPQEVPEPHSRTSHNVVHTNGATHSTMLIIVICVSFVMLICGVGIARLRNQTQITRGKNKHQTCSKVRKSQLTTERV
jgi:calsyntenin 1